MGYFTNFMVYTFAMVGVIGLTLVIFKYSTGFKQKNENSKGLKVTDTLSLSSRKTLYVIETGGERFLIAGDIDRTTLISKLNSNNNTEIYDSDKKTPQITQKANHGCSVENNLGIYSTKKSPYDSMLKNLAEKIRR